MSVRSRISSATGTLWRGVLSAAAAGQSVWDTVTSLGQAFTRAGVPPSVIEPGVVDELTGLAQSFVHAGYTVLTARDKDHITPAMISTLPFSMDLNQFNTSPEYHLYIRVNVEGQTKPVWRTITGITRLPATVGELRDLALANAQAMSIGTTPGGGIGGTVLGVTSIVPTVAPSGA